MALKKNITIESSEFNSGAGFTIRDHHSVSDEFYIRVVGVNASKSNASAMVEFVGNKAFGNRSYDFVPNMEGVNFIKQAYEHLKTLPKFAGAVDC